jgi:hypothetical protein
LDAKRSIAGIKAFREVETQTKRVIVFRVFLVEGNQTGIDIEDLVTIKKTFEAGSKVTQPDSRPNPIDHRTNRERA